MPDINKALTEGTGGYPGSSTAGGYLVPDEYANRIFALVQEKSVALKLVEQINMNGDTWRAPTVTGGTTAYWVGEIGTITASDMTFGEVVLYAKKIAALTALSSELAEDSMTDVMRVISEQMATDLSLSIDSEVFNGTGGQFTNYMRKSTLSGINLITSGSNGDVISLAKISNAIYENRADNFESDYLVCHPRIVRDLRNLTDGNGRPIFDEATFGSPLLAQGVIGTIYGLKVVQTTQLPINITKGTTSDNTDVLVLKSKVCGIFGKRRNLEVHKEYEIESDSWKLQSNLRCAFNIPYPKAICIIQNIH